MAVPIIFHDLKRDLKVVHPFYRSVASQQLTKYTYKEKYYCVFKRIHRLLIAFEKLLLVKKYNARLSVVQALVSALFWHKKFPGFSMIKMGDARRLRSARYHSNTEPAYKHRAPDLQSYRQCEQPDH